MEKNRDEINTTHVYLSDKILHKPQIQFDYSLSA